MLQTCQRSSNIVALCLAAVLLLDVACGSEPSRVIAVADLHGDFDHTLRLLKNANLIEVTDVVGESRVTEEGRPFSRYRGVKWIGGDATLVQLGDLVDRGTYARDLYALFSELRLQAAATSSGRVVNLLGNHDLMNVLNDLRYVSKEDYAEFGGPEQRKKAFSATGWIGRQIVDDFHAAFVAGETLFVHAGLLPEHAREGVEALNDAARQQLREAMNSGGHQERHLLRSTGPFWLRRFATGSELRICDQLQETLSLVNAKRMVIGHTQVDDGIVRTRCNNSLLMADTIISRSAYPECWEPGSMQTEGCEASISYIEIVGNKVSVVKVPIRVSDTHMSAMSEERREL
eukprot:TRINITY_DN77305_c0_g1_i1.p1 TRINITY_DN77305_c0_g1~~TRINITY_DN77305_c0_g1_i1.p1  ORF type:complete len:362 (-),score=36.16 TRINITY_DN77305_c0_g1_i1:25-1062(-)